MGKYLRKMPHNQRATLKNEINKAKRRSQLAAPHHNLKP
jgi:hypothetical protein